MLLNPEMKLGAGGEWEAVAEVVDALKKERVGERSIHVEREVKGDGIKNKQ